MKEQSFMVTCRFPVAIVPNEGEVVTAETVCKQYGGTICELLDDRLQVAGGLQIDDIVAITPVDDRTIATAPVFTYNGDNAKFANGLPRREYEELGHSIRLEAGPRIVCAPPAGNDGPDIHIERRPEGAWSILLTPAYGGDPIVQVWFADDGTGYVEDERGPRRFPKVMEW